jgi:hypothetical protein
VFILEKREPIVEIKKRISSVVIKDFNTDGAEIQLNSAGEMKGRYHGSHMETVDSTFKVDGSSSWQVKAMEYTKEGDAIMMMGAGTSQMVRPMEATIIGEVTYMTNSPRLNWLNGAKADLNGMIDFKNGETHLKVYAALEKAAPMTTPAM